jgi:hypothetical protein
MRWRRPFSRLADEEGSATVEFVVILPVFLLVLLSAIETGMLVVRQSLLERAAGITLREIKIDGSGSGSLSQHKQDFCEASILFAQCEQTVFFTFDTLDTDSWDLSGISSGCADATETVSPVTQFSPGLSSEISVIRICALFDPIFPSNGLGAKLQQTDAGQFAQVVHAAFVSEAGS